MLLVQVRFDAEGVGGSRHNDSSPARSSHHPASFLRTEEDAREIDIQNALPGSIVDLQQRLGIGNAGVGHHYIKAAKTFDTCLHFAMHILPAAYIAADPRSHVTFGGSLPRGLHGHVGLQVEDPAAL